MRRPGARGRRVLSSILMSAAVLALVSGAAAPSSARAQQQIRPAFEPGDWLTLGPVGPVATTRVAVSAAWPDDPFLLAVRANRALPVATNTSTPAVPYTAAHGRDLLPGPPAVRSYDGRQSWQPLDTPLPGDEIAIVQRRSGERVILAIGRVGDGPAPPLRLLRSLDDAQSWTVVDTIPPTTSGIGPLIVSPAVKDDGRIILLTGGNADSPAYQTFDGGLTWAPYDPLPGQRITSITFSPDFAQDQTVFLTAVNAGLFASRDGGDHWASLWDDVEIDGDRYPDVSPVTISPTFAQDGTLFVSAGGPTINAEQRSPPRHSLVALFVSRDRGASWSPVSRADAEASGGTITSGSLRVVLSPAFAENGLALATVSFSGNTPASGGCALYRSVDWGATWRERHHSGQYSGCGPLRFVGDATTAVWYFHQSGWSGTRDGAVTIGYAVLPNIPAGSSVLPRPPVVVADGTAFFAGAGGVIAIGPSARRTDGRLPCPFPEPGPFTAAWAAAERTRPQLGCPLGTPERVTVRERRLGPAFGFWPEDDDPQWLALGGFGGPGAGRVNRPAKADQPWDGPPDRVVEGEQLRYEGGQVLRLPDAAGRWSAYAVGATVWEQLPEAVP